jgi:hypothetical protein
MGLQDGGCTVNKSVHNVGMKGNNMENTSEPQLPGTPGGARVPRSRSRGKLTFTFGVLAPLMLYLGLTSTTAGASTPVAQGYLKTFV